MSHSSVPHAQHQQQAGPAEGSSSVHDLDLKSGNRTIDWRGRRNSSIKKAYMPIYSTMQYDEDDKVD